MRWFTSDQHFGHANIIRYCSRPYVDVDTMNADLVSRNNDTIGDSNDEVWWLGDVAMADAESNLQMVPECAGVKTLVVGNHDRIFGDHHRTQQSAQKWDRIYRSVGFEKIIHGTATLVLRGDHRVLLSHFPYTGDSQNVDRYSPMRPPDEGEWLLHGHVHEKWRQHGRQINVGVDAWAGRPVSETQIVELIDAGPRDLGPLPWP